MVLTGSLICKSTAGIPRFFNLDAVGAEAARVAEILGEQSMDRRERLLRYSGCWSDWWFLEISLRIHNLGEALLGPP